MAATAASNLGTTVAATETPGAARMWNRPWSMGSTRSRAVAM
jgi:hypothetical protein